MKGCKWHKSTSQIQACRWEIGHQPLFLFFCVIVYTFIHLFQMQGCSTKWRDNIAMNITFRTKYYRSELEKNIILQKRSSKRLPSSLFNELEFENYASYCLIWILCTIFKTKWQWHHHWIFKTWPISTELLDALTDEIELLFEMWVYENINIWCNFYPNALKTELQ